MKKLLFRNLVTPPHRPHVALTQLSAAQPASVRHTHDFYEIFLVATGSGVHHINREKVNLAPGHLVVIQPSDVHHFTIQPSQELAILNVAMSPTWWRQFHRLMGASVPQGWFRNGAPEGHVQLHPTLLHGVRSMFEQLAGRDTRAPDDLIEALLRVVALFESKTGRSNPAPPVWLEEWRSEMQAASDTVSESIRYWQKRSGRSAEHLARTCRMFYRCTPTDLLNQARIERAKSLLVTTDEKVISIAYACGFENLANFYRNFSVRTGMTPGTWRKRGVATIPF